MKITVLGTGHMGAALAVALQRTQHEIYLRGSKEGSITCLDLCKSLNLKEAKAHDLFESDIIFFVMPSSFIESAAAKLQGFNGIILSVVGIDNYLTDENKSSISASETIAQLIPTARVVHGFTWMSAETVQDSNKTIKPSVAHCSDDSVALDKVCNLTQEMGFKPVRAGRLINARFAEAAGFLWGAIAIEEGYGLDSFFEVHLENDGTFDIS